MTSTRPASDVTASVLEGSRILVVGASSGIGRAVALMCAAGRAQVVATARRLDRLEALRQDGDHPIDVIAADVRREADCQDLVERAASSLGGLDALVYAAGISPLSPLVDTDGDAWRSVFETNVIGAALVARAALPFLGAARGRALFLSSVSTDDPRPFLVPYSASKAALDSMIRGWRNEHPDLCFVRVVVGPTMSEFGAAWKPEVMAELAKVRADRGLVKSTIMTAEEVAGEVVRALTSPVWVQDVTVMPRNQRVDEA